MLNAAVTSVALDRLAESPRRTWAYWLGSLLMIAMLPVMVVRLATLGATYSIPLTIAVAGVGYAAWAYWTHLVRSRMRHLHDAAPSAIID